MVLNEIINLLNPITHLLTVMWDQFPSFTLATTIQILMFNTLVLKAVMLTDFYQPAIKSTLQTLRMEERGLEDIAPLNIFENQDIPVGVHNLLNLFRPYMATIRVLSLGTKFIPKWKKANVKQILQKCVCRYAWCWS